MKYFFFVVLPSIFIYFIIINSCYTQRNFYIMNILSKNAPLEASILKMQTILDALECGLSFADEKHPLKNCYSINLTSTEAPNHIYSNGKGTLSLASKASALGEYIERLQTNNFFIDFHLPNRALLSWLGNTSWK